MEKLSENQVGSSKISFFYFSLITKIPKANTILQDRCTLRLGVRDFFSLSHLLRFSPFFFSKDKPKTYLIRKKKGHLNRKVNL